MFLSQTIARSTTAAERERCGRSVDGWGGEGKEAGGWRCEGTRERSSLSLSEGRPRMGEAGNIKLHNGSAHKLSSEITHTQKLYMYTQLKSHHSRCKFL